MTGQKKRVPGTRDLRNAWLSGEEYREINVRQQIEKLKAYALTGDPEINLLLRTYSRDAELAATIKEYLEELTYHYEPTRYLPRNFLDRVRIAATPQGGYGVEPRADEEVQGSDGFGGAVQPGDSGVVHRAEGRRRPKEA